MRAGGRGQTNLSTAAWAPERVQNCTWGPLQHAMGASRLGRTSCHIPLQCGSANRLTVGQGGSMLPLPSAWSPAVQTCCEQPAGSVAAFDLC